MGPSRRWASSVRAAASMRTKSEGRSGSAGLGGVLDMVADHVDASRARSGHRCDESLIWLMWKGDRLEGAVGRVLELIETCRKDA